MCVVKQRTSVHTSRPSSSTSENFCVLYRSIYTILCLQGWPSEVEGYQGLLLKPSLRYWSNTLGLYTLKIHSNKYPVQKEKHKTLKIWVHKNVSQRCRNYRIKICLNKLEGTSSVVSGKMHKTLQFFFYKECKNSKMVLVFDMTFWAEQQ